MFAEIPFGDELFAALLAIKRFVANVLSQMHFEVTPSVIFFVAAVVLAAKLVNILMSFQMISEYPVSSELLLTSWKRTGQARLLP